MVIVETSSPVNHQSWTKPLLALSFIVGLGLVAVPVVTAIAGNNTPTGTYLSPMPEQQLAETSPAQTQLAQNTSLTPQEAILSAQAFLEKAISVAQKQPQTQTDKEQIIGFLNQSLNLANQAVALAPQAPQSYLMRARVLSTSSSLRPDAVQLAQKDLEAAQALANGQQVTLPTNINLMDLSPTQQAAGQNPIVIAAPEEDQTKTSTGSASANTHRANATIKRGHDEVAISDDNIIADSYVYLIPAPGQPLIYIKSKTEGEIVVATGSQLTEELNFEYWVVNP